MAIILLYHRVAVTRSDPWGLNVSPEHFRQHLEVLRRVTRPLTIDSLAAPLLSGQAVDTTACAVTFDDGYRDALDEALPVLEAFDVPATFYVPGDGTERTREFWWDELEGVLLAPGTLPGHLSISIGERRFDFALGDDASLRDDTLSGTGHWRTWEEPPTRRHALYRDLWTALQSESAAIRERALDDLNAWAAVDVAPRVTHRTLSSAELRELAKSSFASIGGHTITHARLSAMSAAEQAFEIAGNARALGALLSTPLTSFAYPFGRRSDYTGETTRLVAAAGFRSACSNWEGVVNRSSSAYELPRLFVMDWDAVEFERRIESLRG